MPDRVRLFAHAIIDPIAVVILLALTTLIFTAFPFAESQPFLVWTVCGLAVVLAGLAIYFQVRRVYRQSRAQELLAALHRAGRALLTADSAPGYHEKARLWIGETRAVLEKHLGAAYAVRLDTAGTYHAYGPTDATDPARIQDMLGNLAGILRDLSNE